MTVFPNNLLYPMFQLRVCSQGTQSKTWRTTKSMSLYLTPPLPPIDLLYTHVHIYMLSCAHTCVGTWTHTYLNAFLHNICMPIHTHLWVHRIRVQLCTHTHTHTWQSKRMFSGFRSLQETREEHAMMAQPLSEDSGGPGVLAGGVFMEAHGDVQGSLRGMGT